jgi:predicted phosphodiesterase
MKILALYDIHGNLDALNAVLADPRAEGPDVIVIGGDVAPGPFVPATLDRLDALALPRRWVRGNGEREVAAAVDVAAPDAALVVAGHTHQQDDRVVNGVRFVNAGSVGLPYEGDGDARWPWVQDGVPELRRTAYDSAAAGVRMRDACSPAADSVTAALIEPVDAIVVTRMFEERAG